MPNAAVAAVSARAVRAPPEQVGGDRAAAAVREGPQAPRAHRHRRAGLEDPEHVQEPLGPAEVEDQQRPAGAGGADRDHARDARRSARRPRASQASADERRAGGDPAEPEVDRHLPGPHVRPDDRALDGDGHLAPAAHAPRGRARPHRPRRRRTRSACPRRGTGTTSGRPRSRGLKPRTPAPLDRAPPAPRLAAAPDGGGDVAPVDDPALALGGSAARAAVRGRGSSPRPPVCEQHATTAAVASAATPAASPAAVATGIAAWTGESACAGSPKRSGGSVSRKNAPSPPASWSAPSSPAP